MISLSVVKIRVPDKKYLLTRKELEQVRELLHGISTGNEKETNSRLDDLLKEKHTFENRRQYTLFLDTLKIDEVFYVWSTRHRLSDNETAHISKLINCAINAPKSLLVFPEYIMVSSEPPAGPVKKPTKKKDKGDGK